MLLFNLKRKLRHIYISKLLQKTLKLSTWLGERKQSLSKAHRKTFLQNDSSRKHIFSSFSQLPSPWHLRPSPKGCLFPVSQGPSNHQSLSCTQAQLHHFHHGNEGWSAAPGCLHHSRGRSGIWDYTRTVVFTSSCLGSNTQTIDTCKMTIYSQKAQIFNLLQHQ